MKLEECIVKAIRQSAQQVFATMLGIEIGEGESSLDTGSPEANDGVVGLIGVAGPWTGTGILSCSPLAACRICSHMLMTEASSVDDEVLDAVAELTNMIIGSVKTEMETELGPLALSLPTVVYGRNFKTKSATHSEWVVVNFQWESEVFQVRLCLAKSPEPGRLPAHSTAPTACAVVDV